MPSLAGTELTVASALIGECATLNAAQGATFQRKTKECRELEGHFSECLQEIQDASTDIEATKESLDATTMKNSALTSIVQKQLDHYSDLKERAVTIASQTRSLQARVETLTYAEGTQEVRGVMFGLIDDMQQNEMRSLMNGTGITLQQMTGLLTIEAAGWSVIKRTKILGYQPASKNSIAPPQNSGPPTSGVLAALLGPGLLV
ncbi:MAG: hypothetical protein L6R41_002039 [Letrouitia leprolyta]|nr:MAG: hypothetical protein L6R41_002039 [Letrouitia leprolyta]